MANGKKGKRQIAKPKCWWIIDREFEPQELQLLIDSVQSSRFITPNKAKELTQNALSKNRKRAAANSAAALFSI